MVGMVGWVVFDSVCLKEKGIGNCGVVFCGFLLYGFGVMVSWVEGFFMF